MEAFGLKRGFAGVAVVIAHRAQRVDLIERTGVVHHLVFQARIRQRADGAGAGLQLAEI